MTTKMTRMTRQRYDVIIETTARQVLKVETLDVRGSVELDYHWLSVTQIRDALEAAYHDGLHYQWEPKPTGRYKGGG